MNNDDSIDLKYYIDEKLKQWYIEESSSFYLLINEVGKILYFSEDSLIFFGINGGYNSGDYQLSRFIGEMNWVFIQTLLKTSSENEGTAKLNELINKKNFNVKWKRLNENNEINYFLIFKRELKINEQVDKNLRENPNILDYYKEIISILPYPVVLIKDDSFIFKNTYFDDFVKDKTIINYPTILSWIQSYIYRKNYAINKKDYNFCIDLLDDNFGYTICVELIKSMNDLIILSILPKEIIITNIIEEDSFDDRSIKTSLTSNKELSEIKNDQSNLVDNSIKKIEILQNNIKEIEKNINEKYTKFVINEDSELLQIMTELKNKFKENEEIINITSENLSKMSELANFIDDISVKIHLISINAAIESARSGEAGKGFAVISREIAKLSEATKNYTKMIGTQIQNLKLYTEKISESDAVNSEKKIEKIFNISIELQSNLKFTIQNIKEKIIDELNFLK